MIGSEMESSKASTVIAFYSLRGVAKETLRTWLKVKVNCWLINPLFQNTSSVYLLDYIIL